MTEDRTPEPLLERRHLLRGGAMLAGAAGATVIGAALGSTPAAAADGDTVKVGQPFTGTTTTELTITGTIDPTLRLINKDGPSLHLNVQPTDFSPELDPGDIVATSEGLLVGVDYLSPESVKVATSKDLDLLPLLTPNPPVRLLDTRSATSRDNNILRQSSSSAIDSQGRLTKNSYIDVAVSTSEGEYILSAAFLNVAVISPTADGYLTVYPPGTRPGVSTMNITRGINLSNAAFVSLDEIYQDAYIVRIHSSQTTHVLLDLFGANVGISPFGAEGALAKKRTASLRAARQDKRAAQLRLRLRSGG